MFHALAGLTLYWHLLGMQSQIHMEHCASAFCCPAKPGCALYKIAEGHSLRGHLYCCMTSQVHSQVLKWAQKEEGLQEGFHPCKMFPSSMERG